MPKKRKKDLAPKDLKPGLRFRYGGTAVEILREGGHEKDRFGQQLHRWWSRDLNTGNEGYISLGPTGKFYNVDLLDHATTKTKAPTMPKTTKSKKSAADRLFIGTFPTGISYADRQREKDGDYMRIAFLPFSTLTLEWSPGKHPPELKKIIARDAAQMAKRKGQEYQVSTAGQTVTLGRGHATKKSAAQLDREIAEALGRAPGDDAQTQAKWSVDPSELRVGMRFDYFGKPFEITKIGRDKAKTIQIARRHRDSFGKEDFIDHRSFPMREFYRQHLRPLRG